MTAKEAHEVVKLLLGKINPVGETNEDNKRFQNLTNMCELMDLIFKDINEVSEKFKDSREMSVKRASNYATEFINDTIRV